MKTKLHFPTLLLLFIFYFSNCKKQDLTNSNTQKIQKAKIEDIKIIPVSDLKNSKLAKEAVQTIFNQIKSNPNISYDKLNYIITSSKIDNNSKEILKNYLQTSQRNLQIAISLRDQGTQKENVISYIKTNTITTYPLIPNTTNGLKTLGGACNTMLEYELRVCNRDYGMAKANNITTIFDPSAGSFLGYLWNEVRILGDLMSCEDDAIENFNYCS